MNFKSKLIVLFATILSSSICLGHADHDRARFVSPDGYDIGKCDNSEKPCKTVSYAGLKSNKGDRILLSEGNYIIADVDTLFYLLSDLVPVEGSYSKSSNYSKKHDSNITRLIGVPLELSLIHISEPTRRI